MILNGRVLMGCMSRFPRYHKNYEFYLKANIFVYFIRDYGLVTDIDELSKNPDSATIIYNLEKPYTGDQNVILRDAVTIPNYIRSIYDDFYMAGISAFSMYNDPPWAFDDDHSRSITNHLL